MTDRRRLRIERSLGRRAAWNLVDQVISSLGSAASSFLVARSVGASDFGIFALSFAILTVLVGVSRSLGSQAYAIKFPLEKGRALPHLAGVCLGAAATVGFILSPFIMAASLSFDAWEYRLGLSLFAVLLPFLLVQDAVRSVLLGQGRPRSAALNDAGTTLIQISACLIGARLGFSIIGMIGMWGLGSILGSAVGCAQLLTPPRFILIRAWLDEVGHVSWPLLGEWLALVGFGQVSYVGIGVVSGMPALGAIRAAQTLLGPLGTFGLAVTAFALPHLASRSLDSTLIKRFSALICFSLASMAIVWGALLLMVPDKLGVELLGASWKGAQVMLIPLLVGQVTVALTVGPNTLLAALSRTSRSLRIAIFQGVLLAILGLGGALLLGPIAAVYGLALATACAAPYAWHQLGVAVRLRGE